MPHPILALWAHPRSMSTATERIMRERGDLCVFHEPFMTDYYRHRAPRGMPHFDGTRTEWFDYAEMRARIVAAGEPGPVFFKDMSYYVVDIIGDDPEFARRLTNIFLIRDPRRTIASYWEKDPEATLTEIGLEAQWQHLRLLTGLGQEPMVIEAEAVAADPKAVIGRVWAQAGQPFVAHAFAWQAGDVPESWEHVAGWHDEVVGSTGIRADDRDPDAVFEAAARQAPHLRAYLAHHAPYYAKLRALAA